MAQTELKNIERKVGVTGDNRCGCGATMISGTTRYIGDLVAIQNLDPATTATLDYAVVGYGDATVVDWEWSGDINMDLRIAGTVVYGNFSAIKLTVGKLIAYKRCK